jgi:hypothetical protein
MTTLKSAKSSYGYARPPPLALIEARHPVAGACPSQLVQLNLPGLSAGVQREELSNDVVGGGLLRHIGGDQGNSPAGRGGTL